LVERTDMQRICWSYTNESYECDYIRVRKDMI
jgi:hypothetical protein